MNKQKNEKNKKENKSLPVKVNNKSEKKSSAYTPPSELSLQIVPWILGLLGVFLLFGMFLPSLSGWLGVALKKFFGGLFSYGAYLIPFLLIIRAVKFRTEAISRYPFINWWLSFAFICVFACLLSSIKCEIKEVLSFEHYTLAYNKNGDLTTNSLIGGFFSNIFCPIIGKPFTIILMSIALFMIAPFLVSKTPLDLLRYLARKVRAKREEVKARKEERREYFKTRDLEEEKAVETSKEPPVTVPSKRHKQVEFDEIPLEEEEPEFNVEEEVASREEFIEELPEEEKDITDTEIAEISEKRSKLEKIFLGDGTNEKENLDESIEEESSNAQDVISSELELEDDEPDFEETKSTIDFVENETEEEPYRFPPVELLKRGEGISTAMTQEYEATAKKLVETLASFNVKTKIINVAKGPTVTRYELQPEVGVKVRNIRNLSDDIALNLASKGVRIEAPIPGKAAVGIEVPNKNKSIVNIRELIEAKSFGDSKSQLTTCLGVDVAGNPVYCDIAKMPHILIAGTTGSGKSVCINSLLVSILYKSTPDDVKFILIDPKKIELGVYNGIPHLMVPVVSDPKKAAGALAWAVGEMERRFALIEEVGVRDIRSYNDVARLEEDRETLPRIVIVIDELADLMMMARDNVESSICRIAQKARAAGMHLVIGTQRPSVDVITGLIKANVPSRIAFTVASQVDSKTILDVAGAEKLVGQGDMLYAPVGAMTPTRVQGSYVSDGEIEDIIDFLKGNGGSSYSDEVIEGIEREAERCADKGRAKASLDEDDEDDGELSLTSDAMLKPAIEIALDSGTISTSMLQRRLKLGYARAARLIDKMEALGVVSEFAGSKPRTVLISREKYLEMITNSEE